MIGFPFDSHVTYDENGTPLYDRAISSLPYRMLLSKLFTTGVMPNPSTNLQVIAGEGMSVIVQAGFAVVEGCMKLEEADKTLVVQASHDTYSRIDTVVMRLNSNDSVRSCELYILQGNASSSPVRPELTRTSSIYELGLADILIPANTTQISDVRITDTRYESERCGIVSSISEFDTTTLYHNYEVAIQEWFDNIKDVIDENAAVHLQNEIDTINSSLSGIEEKANSAVSKAGDANQAVSDLSDEVDEQLNIIRGTTLTAILSVGQTKLVFTDDSITKNSTFDCYTDNYKVSAKDMTVSGNSLTMTFKAQKSALNVKVVVR